MTIEAEPYWFSGNFCPLEEEVTAFDLPVTGSVPESLSGRVLRIGPNRLSTTDPTLHHWMMGEGMVHGVRLREGRAAWYRNRWVRSPHVARFEGEPVRPGPQIPLSVLPDGEAAPNTNIVSHAGRTLALLEGGLARPYELTYELETCGPTDLGGTLPEGYTAHPKRDPATGDLHGMSWNAFWGPKVQYTVIGSDGLVRHVADIPIGGPSVVHETSITEKYVLVYDLPMVIDLNELLVTGMPIKYTDDYTPRVGILPLYGTADDVRWFDVNPCAMYHALNAFDDGDQVVVDVCRHPGESPTPLGFGEGFATLDRWTFDLTSGKTLEERIDDRPQEFPRVDEREVGRRHTVGWTAALGPIGGFAPGGTLVKHNMAARTSEARDFGAGTAVSEPLFVPASADAAPGDGWVLDYVYDEARGATDLYILNAADFCGDPAAVVHLPVRVPHTFHGNWCPDE